jgi:hypothetical protein
LGDFDLFKTTVDTIFATMRDFTALPGYDSVRIPGQDRSDVLAETTHNGIPLHPNLVKALAGIAGELNIPELKPKSDLKADLITGPNQQRLKTYDLHFPTSKADHTPCSWNGRPVSG